MTILPMRQNEVHLEEKHKQIAEEEIVTNWSGGLKRRLIKQRAFALGPEEEGSKGRQPVGGESPRPE